MDLRSLRTAPILLLPFFLLMLLPSFQKSFAMDQIVRPYQSVRSAGMGGVRMTTGLYDENFFNNPARVTANPTSKFTLLQVTPAETTLETIKAGTSLAAGTNLVNGITGVTGTNIHDRFQLVLPAYYLATKENRRFAFAIGIITSVQLDLNVLQSYQTNLDVITDVGPAITLGYRFLRKRNLSVGITGRATYRLGAAPEYSLLDFIRGSSLGISSIGGEGSMFNFDVGTTYEFAKWGGFTMSLGFAVQNLLGGDYNNLPLTVFKLSRLPPSQPRSYGFGISALRPTLGFLRDTVFAIELTDLLNNANGSVFRLLHLGGETRWKFLALRAGINQGYWTAGLGLNFHYLTLDFASYGEELGFNAGTMEDRRYTLNLGLHI